MAGEPVVVLLAGEAGVGKSRLVQEIAARATRRGARVLTGGCVDLGGEGISLAPLVDALRSLALLGSATNWTGCSVRPDATSAGCCPNSTRRRPGSTPRPAWPRNCSNTSSGSSPEWRPTDRSSW